MSDRDPDHPLHVELIETQEQLQESLEQVCDDVNIAGSSTDELIRIEETLETASEAAKEAVSLRRRIRSDEGTA